jgi:hypothetical protein
MKLKEFIKNLNKLTTDNPEALDYDVVTSKDDEGNGFNLVYYAPQIGHLDENRDFKEVQAANAVCVN